MYPHVKQMISQYEASEEGEQGDVWPTNVNAIMGISDKQCINEENHGDFKYKYQPIFDNHLYPLMLCVDGNHMSLPAFDLFVPFRGVFLSMNHEKSCQHHQTDMLSKSQTQKC